MMVAPPTSDLYLRFGQIGIKVGANDEKLLRRLASYFGVGFVSTARDAQAVSSLALTEGPEPEIPVQFTPWDARAKDSFADLDGRRIVHKDRTGVVITVQGRDWTMEGPLGRNFSQIVNVIDAMFGLRVLTRGGAMIHSSYVARNGKGISVVGQSGAGKSSVAVRLLEQGFDFVSNDRLILERSGKEMMGTGLPKLPRVNPGTLLAGEATRLMLDEKSRERYAAMPKQELWELEEKYDLDVGVTLGRHWLLDAPIACALVLEWHLNGSGLTVERLRPGQSLAALRSVIKDFGPLDQLLTRRTDTALRDTAERVPMFRITGAADPSRLAKEIAEGSILELAALI